MASNQTPTNEGPAAIAQAPKVGKPRKRLATGMARYLILLIGLLTAATVLRAVASVGGVSDGQDLAVLWLFTQPLVTPFENAFRNAGAPFDLGAMVAAGALQLVAAALRALSRSTAERPARRSVLDRGLLVGLLVLLFASDILDPALFVSLTIGALIVLAGYVAFRPRLVVSAFRWVGGRRRPRIRAAAVAVATVLVVVSPFIARDESPLAFVPRRVSAAEDSALWSHLQVSVAAYLAEQLQRGSAGFPGPGDLPALASSSVLQLRVDAALAALESTVPPTSGTVLRLAILPIYEQIALALMRDSAAERNGDVAGTHLQRSSLALLYGRLAATLKLLSPPGTATSATGHLASLAPSQVGASACPPVQTQLAGPGDEYAGPLQLLRSAGADYLAPGTAIYGRSDLDAKALDLYESARSSRIAALSARQAAIGPQLQRARDRLTHFDAASRRQDVEALLVEAKGDRDEARHAAREEMWGVVRAVPYFDEGFAAGQLVQEVVGTGFDAAGAGAAFGELATSDKSPRLEDYASAGKVIVGTSLVADHIGAVLTTGTEAAEHILPLIGAVDIALSVLTWSGAEWWSHTADETVHQLDEAQARVSDYRFVLSSAVAELEQEQAEHARELAGLISDCTAVASWRADIRASQPASVDDVYALLTQQLGGATPDFEKQVTPVMAMHLTYGDLQRYLSEHPTVEPTPIAVTETPATPRVTPVVAPTLRQPTAPPAQGVIATNVSFAPCNTPAKGYLTGWVNCQGTVTLSINENILSGYVSAYFDWPDAGSTYLGQVAVPAGFRGTIVVPVVNSYVPRCVTSFASYVAVYDGALSSQSKRQLVNSPVTLTASCT